MTKQEREEKLKNRLLEMKRFENEHYEKGESYIAGVDEVGRGPLAGPVCAACVVLPRDFDVLGVDDSKKLSEKKREDLYVLIKEKALAYGIGLKDNRVIDELNILEATKLAMADAISECEHMLGELEDGAKIDHILIDALTLKNVATPQTGIIKGDANSVSIAAASILAKVTRDHMMVEFAEEYPYYGFESNKGYGTAAHYAGIKEHGITKIHRKSFLKNLGY